ncbi:tRNA-specific adenosine deaminase [Aquicella siphonis]|uniref:tRNA-specific adenosine deaminase n=1 Tax=Aquicella siphonis TaxID=254247 RepID=A0A5E4PHA1_9COXI|nr:tRNA adenosine(34) deaminase TadA [Aquicella siphonis]VVC76294.1 tRNA-specific adenosine deaminase [Aquicella siphonis]
MFSSQDEYWMRQALMMAEDARQAGEVPVGAVLVLGDEVIAQGFNCPISRLDPSAHAEMIALRRGAEKISNYRLLHTTLYVTLEPCIMCAGAMVHARIQRLVYGALDPRAGAVVSRARILDQEFLNHRVEYAGGLMAAECGEILTAFFRERR